MTRRILVAACLVCLWALPARATTLTGTVTDVVAPIDGLSFGHTFTVDLPLDSTAVDLCDDHSSGFYAMPSATVTIGAVSYAASETYWEVNNRDGSCLAQSAGVVTRSVFSGAPFWLLTVGWGDTTDEAIPSAIEDGFAWFAVSGFAPVVFATTEVGGGESAHAAEAPEPGSLVLVGTGLWWLRKRQHNREAISPIRR